MTTPDAMSDLMVGVILAALLTAMLLVLIHTARARRLFDQVLAINVFGTLSIALIAAIGLLSRRDVFVDIALLYALVNFVATIAILRLFSKRRLRWPAPRGDGDEPA